MNALPYYIVCLNFIRVSTSPERINKFCYIYNIMQVKINRFFFDGKDIFIIVFGLLLLLHYYFQLHLVLFLQYQSLIVLFFFLLTIRTLATQTKLSEYIAIVLSGILFSFILSPAGIFIYLLSAVLLYTKFL